MGLAVHVVDRRGHVVRHRPSMLPAAVRRCAADRTVRLSAGRAEAAARLPDGRASRARAARRSAATVAGEAEDAAASSRPSTGERPADVRAGCAGAERRRESRSVRPARARSRPERDALARNVEQRAATDRQGGRRSARVAWPPRGAGAPRWPGPRRSWGPGADRGAGAEPRRRAGRGARRAPAARPGAGPGAGPAPAAAAARGRRWPRRHAARARAPGAGLGASGARRRCRRRPWRLARWWCRWRGGSIDSGSTYACRVPASRTPKCRCGAAADRVPVVPTAPRRSPAETRAPARTASDERCRYEVSKPSAVRTLTVRPDHPAVPAKRTSPAGRRHDRRAHRRRDVDPAVLSSGIRVVAVSVRRDRPRPWTGQLHERGRARARKARESGE